jgi:hypothetical protein
VSSLEGTLKERESAISSLESEDSVLKEEVRGFKGTSPTPAFSGPLYN